MLKAAAIFLVVGLVAALLGFTTGASFAIAKILAGIFLFLMVLVLTLFATRTA